MADQYPQQNYHWQAAYPYQMNFAPSPLTGGTLGQAIDPMAGMQYRQVGSPAFFRFLLPKTFL